MVVDAFIYFFFIGAGTASGVGAVALIAWKIVQRSNHKMSKRRGVV